jgi:hypothetical protein
MNPLYICRTTAHHSWGLHELEGDQLKLIDAGALVPLLSVVADRLQARRPEPANFTFTGRYAAEIVANPDPQDMREASAAFAAMRARKEAV